MKTHFLLYALVLGLGSSFSFAENPPAAQSVDFSKVKGIEAKDLRNGKADVTVGTDCEINGATYKPGEIGFDNCMNAAKAGTPTTTGRGEADLYNERKRVEAEERGRKR